MPTAAFARRRRWGVIAPSWLAYVAATSVLRPLSAHRQAIAAAIPGMTPATQAACDASFMAALAVGQLFLLPHCFRLASGDYKRLLVHSVLLSSLCACVVSTHCFPRVSEATKIVSYFSFLFWTFVFVRKAPCLVVS